MSVEYLIPHKHTLKILCKSEHFPRRYKRKREWVFFSEHSVCVLCAYVFFICCLWVIISKSATVVMSMLQLTKRTACGAKAHQARPRVAHRGIGRFLGIDKKCNQVVPWSFHTFPENFMQIGPAVFS